MTVAPVFQLEPTSDGPPHSMEAERALLGLAMGSAEAFHEAGVTAAMFFEPTHAAMWGVIGEFAAIGRAVSPIVVTERLRGVPGVSELGGLAYVQRLISDARGAGKSGDLGAIVADLSMRREMVGLCYGVAARALDAKLGPAVDALTALEKGASDIAQGGTTADHWIAAPDIIAGAIASAQARTGMVECGSGLADLDSFIGGFNRGEVAILAGRPGMGKSVAAVTIAKANAARGRGAAFFSQEMGREQVGLRLACDLAYDRNAHAYSGESTNPTFEAARKNTLSAEQWRRLREVSQEVADWPLWFDTRPGLTVSQIEACSRRAIRDWSRMGIEPGPVIVDHLGIIRPEKQRQGSRHAEVADISRALSEMAKRLDVPVIALCQLNRGVEGREDRRPSLADLRQAGELEEDARLVMFLYREAYYLRQPIDPLSEKLEDRIEREAKLDRCRYRLQWLIAKNNAGQIGQVESFVDIGCSAIRDLGPVQ